MLPPMVSLTRWKNGRKIEAEVTYVTATHVRSEMCLSELSLQSSARQRRGPRWKGLLQRDLRLRLHEDNLPVRSQRLQVVACKLPNLPASCRIASQGWGNDFTEGQSDSSTHARPPLRRAGERPEPQRAAAFQPPTHRSDATGQAGGSQSGGGAQRVARREAGNARRRADAGSQAAAVAVRRWQRRGG